MVEQAQNRLASDWASVNVNEITSWIVPHSTPFELHGHITKIGEAIARNADVNRFAQHMVALSGNATALLAKQGICLRGAVAGYNMKRLVCCYSCAHRVQQLY